MEAHHTNSPDNLQGKDTEYSFSGITFKDIFSDVNQQFENTNPPTHLEVLQCLLTRFEVINFRERAGLVDDGDKLNRAHYLICTIEEIISLANKNSWGLCKRDGMIYVFNGGCWKPIDSANFEDFLGRAAEKIGVDVFYARHYSFRQNLYSQFLCLGVLPPKQTDTKTVLVNFLNGTFEINNERQTLREARREDFLTYQLPFNYTPEAKPTKFLDYLNKVQPDIERQKILAEYVGYLFIKNDQLKLEKTLLLYGTGANGKSVFFEVICAMLGKDANVSNYSLQSLTDQTGYYRAMIADKLLNYASEINGKLEMSFFKQLVSGEPVEARVPYGKPMTISQYARMIFNCNELPKDIEHTEAFYRRLLIVSFDQTIPPHEQDKELAQKIITSELSGVFNWVLEGLKRLLIQKDFSHSVQVKEQVMKYREQADSVRVFLNDEGYKPSTENYISLKQVFSSYKTYCNEGNFRPCNLTTFSGRLKNCGYEMKRMNIGNVVYIEKVL